MFFTTPKLVKETPEITFNQVDLENSFCGLFRAPLSKAASLLPVVSDLLDTAPITIHEKDWEVDVKIHMLFKGQYPCIPNWHCDNVPRNKEGKLDYSAIDYEAMPMYLWVSDSPTTEFLDKEYTASPTPKGHDEVADIIRANDLPTLRIAPKAWYSMHQDTPHRGRAATENGWRVFVRLTHKDIAPVRPVNSFIRRHCQVYLDSKTFSW